MMASLVGAPCGRLAGLYRLVGVPHGGRAGSGTSGTRRTFLRSTGTTGSSPFLRFSSGGAPSIDRETGARRMAARVEEQPMTANAASSSAGASEGWRTPTWDEVVAQHSARVYRLAYRLTGNPHDAEDLTQEVFVRVFRSLSTATRPAPSRAGCTGSPRTCSSTRPAARPRSASTRSPTAPRPGIPSRAVTPDSAVLDGIFDDDVEDALAALPPDFRAAVVLCDIEGLQLRGDRRRARPQARHRPLPHPPRPQHAAQGAGAPCPRGRAAPATPAPPTCPGRSAA